MSKRKELEFLADSIKSSGYPLEIETSNLLEKKNFVVSNTCFYYDEEIKEGRSIDILAAKETGIQEQKSLAKLSPFNMHALSVIECKKTSAHAWIFYVRPSITASTCYLSGQYLTYVPRDNPFDFFRDMLEARCRVLHYDKFKRFAIAYQEIKKQKTNEPRRSGSVRNEIFEGVNQLVRFLCYEIHQRLRNIDTFDSDFRRENIGMVFFFPIIVFDGDMYQATFDSGKLRLKRAKHVVLITNHHCPYCNKAEGFTIDVVHRSYFEEFVDILEKDRIALFKMLLRDKNFLLERARLQWQGKGGS